MTATALTTRPVRAPRALGLVLAGSLLLAGCADDPEQATEPTPTASPSMSDGPTPSETADPSPADLSPVYFVVDTRTGLRLAREPRELTAEPGIDASSAAIAVAAMISGPADPDYSTTWNPDTEVLSVEEAEDGTITVDLSADARRANVGSPGAALMIQQLVWTVTELIDPEAPVQLLIEGEPAGELWGAVSWAEPIAREDADDVRALVGIDTPVEGALVSSPFTVIGEANAFEANVPWRVLDTQGNEVATGYATATEGMTFSPYSFDLNLDPGTYTVEVSEDDPSGGEAGEPMTDTRTITVE